LILKERRSDMVKLLIAKAVLSEAISSLQGMTEASDDLNKNADELNEEKGPPYVE
jgi:hypothetical protein